VSVQAFIIAADAWTFIRSVVSRTPAKRNGLPTREKVLPINVVLEDLAYARFVGVATESGELGEVILAHMNSRDPIDRVKCMRGNR